MGAIADMYMGMLSRREWVRVSCWGLASLFARRLAARPVTLGNLRVELAHEFAHSRLLAVSPDGTRLCLEDWKASGYPFRVLEIDTWQTIYAGRLQTRILDAQFFADSQAMLLVIPPGRGQSTKLQTILNVRTGEQSEHRVPFSFDWSDTFFPLADRILLVQHYEGKPRSETTSVSLVNFSDRAEIRKVPYATQARKPRLRSGTFEQSSEYDFRLSDDRKVLAYSFDDVLVCRRTDNLEVLWTKTIEEGLRAYKVALSSDGSYVAAACVDPGYFVSIQPDKHPTKYFIEIYDGKTGQEVARLPVSGTEGIALSRNGELMAVVARTGEPGRKNVDVATVHIYEVSSGRKLASIVHDRISGGNTFLTGGCIPAFTSDGKHLVTSQMITKVWRLIESA